MALVGPGGSGSGSAIADYATLQTKIASWLHRSDLTSMIPDFIALAEQRMNSDLNARDMEVTTNVLTAAGVPTADTPTDVIETRRLTLTSTDPQRVLSYMPPEKLRLKYASSNNGEPEVFTVIGGQFQFGPTPDAIYTAEYIYRQRIPALSNTNTFNWILTKWPYIYVYGAMCAAAPFLRDDTRVALWEKLYQDMVEDINGVDWYSGATMRVRNV